MKKMRIEPLPFKDFDSGVAIIRAGAKPFLPGGRRRSEAPPPPPPIFNETQLKAAERESYKKGFLEGIEEGKKQRDIEQARLVESLEHLLKNSAVIFNDYRNTIVRAQQDLPKAALLIARKVADGALEANAQAAVETMALRCVEFMLGEPKLQIVVHESLADSLKKKIAELTVRMPEAGNIVVVGKTEFAVTDCRIEWKDGALTRSTQKIWEDIAQTVEGMRSSAKHQAEAHADALQAASAITNETTTGKKE